MLHALLAWRYIGAARQEQTVSLMIKICFLGIFIGTGTLALVLAVMRGFEHATHRALQGIQAPVVMRAHGQQLDVSAIAPILQQEFACVHAYSPHRIAQVMIDASATSDQQPIVVLLKGIEPEKERLVSCLESMVIEPVRDLSSSINNQTILIGAQLAHMLEVKLHDTVSILYTDQTATDDQIKLQKQKVTIGGIFKTGIEEFDTNMIFCNPELFDLLYPDVGVTQIALRLNPDYDEASCLDQMKERFGLDVTSWKELYKPIMAALQLEQYAMFFILVLITLVASMNMISLLFMLILHKQHDIALLITMGMSPRMTAGIFMLIGMIITALATILGIGCATIISILINRYKLISLPETYYVSHLPAHMSWQIAFIVFIVALLLGFLTSCIAVRRLKNPSVISLLKNSY